MNHSYQNFKIQTKLVNLQKDVNHMDQNYNLVNSEQFIRRNTRNQKEKVYIVDHPS